MTLKAIVFDLDGTLVDQDGAERDALRLFYDQHLTLDPKPSYQIFLRDWRNEADQYLQRFLDSKMGFEEQRIARIQAVYAKYLSPCTLESATHLARTYADLYRAQWRPYADTLPALRALGQRYRLAIITNGEGAQQRAKLDATGLTPFFAHILVSGDTGVRKPDPAIFRLSEQALNLGPQELAYVGDRLNVDVEGALAADWTAVWLDRKGMPKELGQNSFLVAEGLGELESLLKRPA